MEINGMKYIETERGRFDSNLVNVNRDGVVVAYTDCDTVIATSDRIEEDCEAIEKFASWYDLKIEWR